MVQFLKSNFSVFDMFGIFLPAVIFCLLLIMINYYSVISEILLKDTVKEQPNHLQTHPKAHFQTNLPNGFYCNIKLGVSNSKKHDNYIIKAEPIVPVHRLLVKLNSLFKSETQKILFYIFSFCFIVYFIGHLLMSMGSSFIDRFVVRKCLGYPYEQLFSKISFREYPRWHELRKMFYPTLILNTCLVSLISIYIPNTIISLTVLLGGIAWCTCMHIIKERYNKKRTILNQLYKKGNDEKKQEAKKELDLLVDNFEEKFKWYSVGTFWFYRGIYKWLVDLHGHKSFPDKFQDSFKEMFDKDYFKLEDARENIFWLAFTCVHDNSPNSCAQLLYARRLVYLFRNLTISFFLAFVACVSIQYIVQNNKIILAIYASCFLLFSILSFIRFYYIYFNSYSKNVFRAYYEYKCRGKLNEKNGDKLSFLSYMKKQIELLNHFQ